MRDNENFAKEVVSGVIDFLEKKGKLNLLDRVIRLLQEKSDSDKITVLTPRPLILAEKDRVVKLVRKIVGDGKNEIVFAQDVSLLDGLRIESKNKIWDFSLSNQLSRFRKI